MKKRCDWHPVDNLRSCIVNRPPLVLFTGCLLMVAAAFVYGGLYINTHPIQNPDISWDWNLLLMNMEQLNFCIKESSDSSSTKKLPQKMADLYLLQPPASHNTSTYHSSYSATLMVAVDDPLPAFFQQNVTPVLSSVLAGELGLRGNLSKEIVNITMFIHAVNDSERPLMFPACIVLSAPVDVFPKTRLLPTQCHASSMLSQVKDSASGSSPVGQRGGAISAVISSRCEKLPRIKISYKSDPALTVMLTEDERDLVHVHLIHSSYFMFFMVLAVLVYGVVRNRGAKMFTRLPSILSKDGQEA